MKLELLRSSTLNLPGQSYLFNMLLTNLNQWSDSVPVYCILMITVSWRSHTKHLEKQIHCSVIKPQFESQAELRVKTETLKRSLIMPALQPQMVVLPSPGIPLNLPLTPKEKKKQTKISSQNRNTFRKIAGGKDGLL